VRRTPDEPLFNSLMEHHHYLGYEQPVGEHLKYVVWAQGRPIPCLAWSSAPRRLGSRDRFIVWSAAAQPLLPCLQHTLSDSALGRGTAPGFAPSRSHGEAAVGRLGMPLPRPDLFSGRSMRWKSCAAICAGRRSRRWLRKELFGPFMISAGFHQGTARTEQHAGTRVARIMANLREWHEVRSSVFQVSVRNASERSA